MSFQDLHIQWLKDDVFTREGKRAEVIIEDCELTDGGDYSVVCTQENDISTASLTVVPSALIFCISKFVIIFLLNFLCDTRAFCLSEDKK